MHNLKNILDVNVVILAAGKGTRMRSELPKVLHKIAQQPMLEYVLKLVEDLRGQNELLTEGRNLQIQIAKVALVTSLELANSSDIQLWQQKYNFDTVIQEVPLGTGHAVSCAMEYFNSINVNVDNNSRIKLVLVLYGDTPFIELDSIKNLIINMLDNSINELSNRIKYKVGLLGFTSDNPDGYGRLMLSNDGKVLDILEAEVFKQFQEKGEIADTLCNSGIMVAEHDFITRFISASNCDNNSKKEFYLTDIVKYATSNQSECVYIKISESEALGINNSLQKARAEALIQSKIRNTMIENGVGVIASETVFFSADTQIDPGVVIYPYVWFGPGVSISSGSQVLSFSHIERANIGQNNTIGPFARIRGNSNTADNCKVGNFSEVKNAKIDKGVKANHFCYLGDINIGENTNIGAGTVICNYDGVNKHMTSIGKNAFIGSNSSIVSPVQIGDNSVIGAGSTIVSDVLKDELSIARAKQVNMPGKARKKSTK